MCEINTSARSVITSLFRELPYSGYYSLQSHDQFNNSLLTNELPTKRNLNKLPCIYDIDLFNLNVNSNTNPDRNSNFEPIQSRYYSSHSFSCTKKSLENHSISFLHSNIRSLRRNIDNFQNHLLSEL